MQLRLCFRPSALCFVLLPKCFVLVKGLGANFTSVHSHDIKLWCCYDVIILNIRIMVTYHSSFLTKAWTLFGFYIFFFFDLLILGDSTYGHWRRAYATSWNGSWLALGGNVLRSNEPNSSAKPVMEIVGLLYISPPFSLLGNFSFKFLPLNLFLPFKTLFHQFLLKFFALF